jgi:hypothetical protein
VGVTRIFAVFGPQWMQVLKYVIPYQEVMTHIDVGDDNSTPEQNMVCADKSNSHKPFRLADFAADDAVRRFSVRRSDLPFTVSR